MIVLEFKLAGAASQYTAFDEAIRTTQFIRNKCVRKWRDERGVKPYDLNRYCAILAKEYDFAGKLNSQARQAAAERAAAAIVRFYDNCRAKKPGMKGYPQFQKDCRSIEYKQTRLETGRGASGDYLHGWFQGGSIQAERHARFGGLRARSDQACTCRAEGRWLL
jgi:transposase